ncbi:hypothetical protein GV794_24845 [Nocardia cyriacigeorgica]|uniref:Uncharacterized protein n=1 Tax=Nocardia cyriacigeorgica TaxID=135487 RepID=A0A6P1DAX6_9NOCA|nr:hypothetical protein [Nocardia cyriacigeorgica]NEW42576.1 hypothetical protein [Nocardia cyriacigeorgica]NEW47278.1 hypothetical protein [Nocardia cyriacigeorgica]NEW53681.1 hypothetical protein [Nocardia cyriacigeorgica]NEW58841.1 hypothetical protein [Nocardia cyriacigeorgica]
MNTTQWQSLANAVLYSVQFEETLDSAVVTRVADGLLTRPLWNLAPEDEYQALTEAVRASGSLTREVPTEHTDAEFRRFLGAVIEHLDSARPWPEPPFELLPDERFEDFMDGHAIAIADRPVATLEGLLGKTFIRREDIFPDFLLLRLRSGTEIGFIWPYWRETNDVAIVTPDRDRPAMEILTELVQHTNLESQEIIPLRTPSTTGEHNARSAYETVPLREEFAGENLPGNRVWNGSQVVYLDEHERQRYRLHIRDGFVYDDEGRPFDTTAAKTLWTPQGGRAIFTMDADGTLYSSPHHVLGQFHHSSLLAGAPVAGAGEIAAMNGVVQLISDHSTHYRPPRHITEQVVDNLRSQGVTIDDQQVEYHWDTGTS